MARGRALRAFSDLRADDIVVHSDHGIARFTGFDTKTVGKITRDYLELEYRGGDRVFVPTDQLDKLSRYVGADAGTPTLSKLGSKTWENMKAKARRAAHELAGELLNVYAQRRRQARPHASTATPSGSSRSSRPSRSARPTTSSRRSSRPRPTWSRSSRWTG